MRAGAPVVVAVHVYRHWAKRYWKNRTVCLYGESCSRRVEREARETGLFGAMNVMVKRFRSCQPGYSFEYKPQGWSLVCRDGTVIESRDASGAVALEAHYLLARLPLLNQARGLGVGDA
jgi:putative component of membrane protein insertase Oxa1/YidC/SpoIIIJ protein YidD